MSPSGSIAIIGGGITGMFCAYYLLKEGHSVKVIDTGLGACTSKDNAGLLTPSLSAAPEMGYADLIKASTVGMGAVYISPVQILKNIPWFIEALKYRKGGHSAALADLGVDSLALYRKFFKEEGIDADVIRGVGAFFREEGEARDLAERLGGRFIGQERISKFGYKGLGGGVMFDNEISINSHKLFAGLRSRIEGMGAEMILGSEARLNRDGTTISSISAGSESVTADTYIAAGGSWLNNLLSPIGYNPKVMPARGLVMMFSTKGRQIVSAPCLIEPDGIGVTQHDRNTVRVTSMFEFKGFDTSYSDARKSWIIGVLKDHLSRYKMLRPIYEGSGFRPCTTDQMPVIGRVPNISNLFVAGGHCRLGMTLAPVTGKIITGMVDGERQRYANLRYMSPGRFG